MDRSIWAIETFETNSGDKPVDNFILKQQPSAKSKIAHTIKLLAQYGNNLGMPHTKILGSGLYELRIRGKEEIRIFYCFKKTTIYLLHAFKKQTQRTPTKEFELTMKRMQSLIVI